MSLLAAATWYLKNNISVVATDANKRSLFRWKEYQTKQATIDEITKQLSHEKAAGLALICGAVSGNIEVIDVDCKYDLSGKLFDLLKTEICAAGLWDKLYIIKTKSAGYHLYYKCEVIEGNQKLAMRLPSEQELKDNPSTKFVTLIETRGEAGYVIAPPTEGYTVYQKNDIPILSIDERDNLLTICRSFNLYIESHTIEYEKRSFNREYGLTPFDDYNKRSDVIDILIKNGWTLVETKGNKIHLKRPGDSSSKTSGNFDTERNWFTVFSSNTIFKVGKAYLPYAVYTMLECDGDYKKAVKKLSKLGYGEKWQNFGGLQKIIYNKKRDGATEKELVTIIADQENKPLAESEVIYDTMLQQFGPDLLTFWDIDYKGKMTINRFRLERFLSDIGGFYLYFHTRNNNAYRMVRVENGILEEASIEQLKKFVKNYVHELPEVFDGGKTPPDLLEVVYRGSDTYFSKAFLEFIDNKAFDILKDDAETAYFPFRNGVVVIEKLGDVKLKTYGEINKVVWREQIIDFDVSVDIEVEITLVEYFIFLQRVCANDEIRWRFALTLIGYMLHSHKDPSSPFAPILAEETEDEQKGGGTGKGLFINAVSKLIPVVRIDGKNFKIDKTFAFQRVTLGTRMIVIEDCPKAFDFEKYYPTITEGITIEKKNKDEIFLPYAISPKIAFTTNYSINQSAEHAKRRQRVMEFAEHYNSRHSPKDEFKHSFFDDWDNDEWNRFYNLLFLATGMYLDRGVEQPNNSEKLKRKHIRLGFGDEFLDYIEHKLDNKFDSWSVFNEEYNSFLKSNDWDKKDFSNKRFKKGLIDSGALLGYKLETQKNRQNNNLLEFRYSRL